MNQRPLRIVFAGTPLFAALHLQSLLEWPAGTLVAVYTQPDRPAGRGKKLAASPVKELALAHHLPVLQPPSLRTAEAQQQLAALAPDVMVVVAYGLILPVPILVTPRLGCINVHASVLPRWRGAAPIQRAIEAGDHESGVTIMQMDEGLDTGAMLNIVRCPIAADDTAASLHDRLAALGAPALLETLAQLGAGTARPLAQDAAHSCYAAKISREEAALDWQRDAPALERQIRAFNPVPVSHGTLQGERVKIYRARLGDRAEADAGTIVSADRDAIAVACGDGSSLLIERLQLPGGRVLSCAEVLNGRADLFRPGNRFQDA